MLIQKKQTLSLLVNKKFSARYIPFLESIELLTNGFDVLRKLCIDGITANKEHCREMVDNSIGTITALVPVLGYKQCTKLAKEALETGKGVVVLIREHGLLTEEQINDAMAIEKIIL